MAYAAVAALCHVVAGFVAPDFEAGGGIIGETKSCSMFVAEEVDVFKTSRKPQRCLRRQKYHCIIAGNVYYTGHRVGCVIAGADDVFSLPNISGYILQNYVIRSYANASIEVTWKSACTTFIDKLDGNFQRTASLFDNIIKVEVDRDIVNYWNKPGPFQIDQGIGALLGGKGGHSSNVDLLFPRSPKSDCRYPKCGSEECHSYTRQSGDGALINISDVRGTNAVQPDADEKLDDEEFFFVKGLVVMAILALMYAVSKRIRRTEHPTDCRKKRNREQAKRKPPTNPS